MIITFLSFFFSNYRLEYEPETETKKKFLLEYLRLTRLRFIKLLVILKWLNSDLASKNISVNQSKKKIEIIDSYIHFIKI